MSKNEDYRDEKGNFVWRTVGGRRIKIYDGQNLSDAMKKSGKFTKKGERDRRTISKKEMEEDFNKKAKEDPEFSKQIDKMREELKERDKADRIKSQQSDIEKASGLKVKEAFETDAFGTGKEDRFKLEDGRWISHSTESMGQKEDAWSINEFKNGSVESKNFKSYDDMIKDLSRSNKSDKYAEYYKKEHLGEPSNYQKGDKIEYDTGYYETTKGSIIREATDEEKKYVMNSNLKGYVVKDADGNEHIVSDTRIKTNGVIREKVINKKNNKSEFAQRAYKKAFEEYKKKHPNSKLNFNQFIDMSEGK